MADICKSCDQKISYRALKVKCSSCSKPFHAACQGMSKEDVEHVSASDFIWRCQPCQAAHRRSMRLDQAVDDNTVTLADIMDRLNSLHVEMTDMRREQRNMEDALGKSIEMCFASLEEVKEDLKKVKMEHKKQLDELGRENQDLKAKVGRLEAQLDDSEQYSRRNTVEIFGVPEVPDENILQTVAQVGNGLGFNVEPAMVDACHRLAKRSSDPHPRGIIVKFVRRFDKEEMLKKKRAKKGFTAKDAGFATAAPIYINESLSPMRRRLMKAARDARRQLNYKYLWSSNGRILLKKEDTSPVIVINNFDDINNVK